MNKSENIERLAFALSAAQAKMPTVKFNSKNPFLKNKYADLGALIDTARPILAENGLAVSQFPVGDGKLVGVSTILIHSSGEWLENTIYIQPDNAKGLSVNQSAGVSITYLRRYAYASVLGLFADEDTDGHVEEVKTEKPETKKRVWSIDAMEAVIEYGGLASNHEESAEILDLSLLPENAPVKTVKSWVKRFAEANGDTSLACADVANDAYMKAKGAK